MAEYRLTPAAESDFENIWLYTRHQWSTEQADRYIEILVNAFVELSHSPKIAPGCDHIRNGYRRRSVDRHVIYFLVTDYGIAIIRGWMCHVTCELVDVARIRHDQLNSLYMVNITSAPTTSTCCDKISRLHSE